MEKLAIFHVTFNIAPYSAFINDIIDKSKRSNESRYVCIANVHMLIEAYKNEDFANNVRKADIVTPDGLPITWALRLLHGIKQERVAGMDLLPDILKKAEEESIPVYFYGGTEVMLDKTLVYTSKNFPSLNVAGTYSPPFRNLSAQEEENVANKVNLSGARIVFVILGCPKQEKWMAGMKGRINAMMIGVGGALPVMVGMQKRAPVWMQQSGLEWLYRLKQDPRRLWKRYFVTNSVFLYLLFVDKLKLLFISKPVYYKRVNR
jgi:N-acetylglucosaminyldiphosphoundecaprenol N-acetyl-beta-D-mannosaminyltransferase